MNEQRKNKIRDYFNSISAQRNKWLNKNSYFHQQDYKYLQFLVTPGQRVLDMGCGIGNVLHAVSPEHGVGVDFSDNALDLARQSYPEFEFIKGDIENTDVIKSLQGPFDVILLSDTIGFLEDIQSTLNNIHGLCHDRTRIIVSYHNRNWAPILKLGVWTGLKMPEPEQNWLSSGDIKNILEISDFDVVKREWRQLLPKSFLGIGTLINRYIAPLPIIRRLCLRNYVVARSLKTNSPQSPSVTVVIPCRNERGNIENAVKRTPQFAPDMEFLYIEGNSSDDTFEEIQRVQSAYPDLDIKALQQDGKGKGDAVRKAFSHARGDVLMILDADLTMPPEDLPKYYEAICQNRGEFINGSRLVYPMESYAMRFLNLIANQMFSFIFSWLLNQRFTDTLCGTKVLLKSDYEKIAANRHYFGDFDPFGDFDLIFGAAKLNLKVVEIPIRYAGREYGETQISRFSHGVLLIKMVWFAFRKLKAF